MTLFHNTLSPFVRKVMAYGAEKGIALELKGVNPGSPDPEFRDCSPFGKIPGFRDGDFAISDSSAIVAYILLWISMVLGLAITNKLARTWPGGPTFADLNAAGVAWNDLYIAAAERQIDQEVPVLLLAPESQVRPARTIAERILPVD